MRETSDYDMMWAERRRRLDAESEIADLKRKIEKLTAQRDALLDILASR